MGKLKKQAKTRKKFSDMPTFSWKGGEPDLSERIDEILYGDPHGLDEAQDKR